MHSMPNMQTNLEGAVVTVGGKRFMFEHPATIRFERKSGTGTLASLEGGGVTLPWPLKTITLDGLAVAFERRASSAFFTLPGGEYPFTLTGDALRLSTKTHLGRIEVSDGLGKPAQWVHVFRDIPGGRSLFQGATDAAGTLTLRWTEEGVQSLTLVREKNSMRATVKPGAQKVAFP